MRIGVVYTGLAGYMVDCWRELSHRRSIELRIWDEETIAFSYKGDKAGLLDGLDCNWEESVRLDKQQLEMIVNEIAKFKPDIVFVCGWARKIPPFVARADKLKEIPMVLDMDMPWELCLRKMAARFILWRRMRRFSAVFVPGKSSAIYARWLGFPRKRIFKGRNCIDLQKFHSATDQRSGFLFVGRHVYDKGLDVLDKAFAEYKRIGGEWSLTIPAFVEPDEVPAIMRKHACFILPSRFEPWGVVVLEALASGMKTIVSDRVGSRFDLPVDAIFRSGDYKALAAAMTDIEHGYKCKALGKKDPWDISSYSTSAWADRMLEICEKVL